MTKPMPPTEGHTSKRSRRTFDIFVVSEATGSLGRHMTSVVLSQFPQLDYRIHHRSLCANAKQLRAVRATIAGTDAPLVLSALTQRALKRSLSVWCQRRGIPYDDLLEHVVRFVAEHSGHRPRRDASRAHRCDEEYLHRIDAWEYTLQHDDSRRLETIDQADVILIGVSRVGKTPLAAYLGSLGHRVANVALSPECPVPSQILRCRRKTIGLTIRPQRLAEIRERRFELNRFKQALRTIQGEDHEYYSVRRATRDILFSEQQFRKLRLRTIDTTDMTVEEAAAHVVKLLRLET